MPRVIYDKGKDVVFSVEGKAVPQNGTYTWDLKGDGHVNAPYNGAPNPSTNPTITVQYTANADARGNIQLKEAVENRRQKYNAKVTVKDSNGIVVANLSVLVRVHLDGNFGTAFPAKLGFPNNPNQSAINTYLANTFAWGGNVPGKWSNLPANIDQAYQTVLGLEKLPSQARLQYVAPANQPPGAAT